MVYRSSTILIILIVLVGIVPLTLGQETTPEVTAEVEPTATLGGTALHFVSGKAAYQNRLPDQSGIEIQVLDEALNLIGVARTDAQGVYAVAAPSDAFYWLVVDAPLHRSLTIPMYPGDSVPDVVLAGGDFNEDGCVGPTDLDVLVGALDVAGSSGTDVTGDGMTDVSDLAIVTGNYQPDCEPEPTETPTPESTIEVTPEVESTAEMAPEVTEEITPEVEITAEVTVEVTSEVTPEIEVTAEITPEMTAAPEVTAEVTEELIPEVTEEMTPEVTDEPTIEPPTATLIPTQTPTLTPEPTLIPSLTPEPTFTETPTATSTEVVPERTEES